MRALLFLGILLVSLPIGASPAMAGLLPGGPATPKQLAADCYVELDVAGLGAAQTTSNAKGAPTVLCGDGDACDQGPAGDDACVIRVAPCINQTNVAECSPPSALEAVKATGKVKGIKGAGGKIVIDTSQLLEGEICGPSVNVAIPVKVPKNGAKRPGKASVQLSARAPKGTVPRSDKDKITLACAPLRPLAVVLTATPDPVEPGGQVFYQLSVINRGTEPLSDVALRVTLPQGSNGCQMDGATRVSGTCGGGSIYEWPVENLAAGASRTVLPVINLGSSVPPGQLLTEATASAPGVEPTTVALTTEVASTAPFTLRMTDAVDPSTGPGGTITYRLTFGNQGSARAGLGATLTRLTASIPAGTTIAAISDAGVAADGSVTWELAPLGDGVTHERSFSVTIDQPGASAPGFRQAFAELGDDSTEAASSRASAVTVLGQAALALTMTGTPDPVEVDGHLTYQLMVTNRSDAPLTGLRLRWTLPTWSNNCYEDGALGSGCGGAGVHEWTRETLLPGASWVVMPWIALSQSTPGGWVLFSEAQVTADGGQSARTDLATPVEPAPAFVLRMTDEIDPTVGPGGTITYRLTFGNRGAGRASAGATATKLTALIPPNTSLATISDAGVAEDGAITWQLDPLDGGRVHERSFSVTVDDLDANEPDFRQAFAELEDDGASPASSRASVVTAVAASRALALAMTATPDPGATPFGQVSYQLSVTNRGTIPLSGVTLHWEIPTFGSLSADDGGDRVSDSGSGGGGTVYEWTQETLLPGASWTLMPGINLNSGTPPGWVLLTQARVTTEEGQSARADVAGGVEMEPPFSFHITDEADPASGPGSTITYRLRFGNRGAARSMAGATKTRLIAVIPSGTTVSEISDSGTADGGLITWELEPLSGGTTHERSFAVTVEDLAPREPGFRQVYAELDDDGTPAVSSRASAVTVVEPAPVLRLGIVALPDPVQPFPLGQVAYHLTVTNEGTEPLNGVTLHWKVPSGTSVGDADGGERIEGAGGGGTVYQWDQPTLLPGVPWTVMPSANLVSSTPVGSVLFGQTRVTDDGGRNARADAASGVHD